MAQDGTGTQVVNLIHEFHDTEGVCFDPEHITLEGTYSDQISAYRAKRVWVETLAHSFLLEKDHDFKLSTLAAGSDGRFALRCEFMTACARYAFWRLTNNQAPEAQYIIETAHIPHAESRQEDFWTAPDLKLKGDASMLAGLERAISNNRSASGYLSRIFHELFGRLLRMFARR